MIDFLMIDIGSGIVANPFPFYCFCYLLIRFGSDSTYPWICLDMIKPVHRTEAGTRDRTYHDEDYNGGWSTAYSVYSILMQFQAFLFDENVPQSYGKYSIIIIKILI